MGADVVGLGNAIMDALVMIEGDDVLDDLGLIRGTMHPVSHEEWMEVFRKVQEHGVTYESGGSCANTIATLGRLGAQVLYSGQVGSDDLGAKYIERMNDACGRHAVQIAPDGATGKCLSLVSKTDAERTMVTDLGCSIALRDITGFLPEVQQARIAHFTGYTLLDGPMLPLVETAMAAAAHHGALVSLDVADPFVVQAIRDRLWKLIDQHVDIVFLNAEEARSLTEQSPEHAIHTVASHARVKTVVVKLGSKGSLVAHDGKLYEIPIHKVNAIDTTGAGDAYAGGFLYGMLQGWDPRRSGMLASSVAAATVAQLGAVVADSQRLQALAAQLA